MFNMLKRGPLTRELFALKHVCVPYLRSGTYLLKPDHWHHHLGDLASFSKKDNNTKPQTSKFQL